MGDTDERLDNNAAHAGWLEFNNRAKRPERRTAIAACMDARLDIHRVRGLQEGVAHVIGNADAVVGEEVTRSLALSQHKLGTDGRILIHHGDCGMPGRDDAAAKTATERDSGRWPALALAGGADRGDGRQGCSERVVPTP